MTKPVEPPDHSWIAPVYMEKPASLDDYAVCKYCNEIRMNHLEDYKCMFDSSSFVQKIDPRFVRTKEDTQCPGNANTSVVPSK